MDQTRRDIGATGHQEAREITKALVGHHVDSDQEDHAYQGDDEGGDNVETSLAEIIRRLCDGQQNHEPNRIGGDCPQIGLNGAETQPRHNLREEIGRCRKRHRVREGEDHPKTEFPVAPDLEAFFPAELGVHNVGCVAKGSCLRRGFLVLVQEPRTRGGGGEPPERHGADNDGKGSFDDEEPFPAFDTGVLDLEDAVGDQAAEGGGEKGRAKEDCETEAELIAGVEEGEVKDHTGEEAGFACT